MFINNNCLFYTCNISLPRRWGSRPDCTCIIEVLQRFYSIITDGITIINLLYSCCYNIILLKVVIDYIPQHKILKRNEWYE